MFQLCVGSCRNFYCVAYSTKFMYWSFASEYLYSRANLYYNRSSCHIQQKHGMRTAKSRNPNSKVVLNKHQKHGIVSVFLLYVFRASRLRKNSINGFFELELATELPIVCSTETSRRSSEFSYIREIPICGTVLHTDRKI